MSSLSLIPSDPRTLTVAMPLVSPCLDRSTGKLMGIQSREHGINASRVFVEKFGARNLQDLMQVDATMLCSWKSDPHNNISHPRLDIERRGFFYDYTHAFVDGCAHEPTLPCAVSPRERALMYLHQQLRIRIQMTIRPLTLFPSYTAVRR